MLFDFTNENFINLMENKSLALPIEWDGIDLAKELSNGVYKKYSKLLSVVLSKKDLKEINKICNAIVAIINIYYNGFPAKAYTEFSKMMETLWQHPIKVYSKSVLGSGTYNNDPLKLYRIRKIDDSRLYHRQDIFHTPFDKRAYVSSSRYSIAGYPSLYLGTNLELCNLEVHDTYNIRKGIASRYKLDRNYSTNGNIRIKVIEFGVKPNDFITSTKIKKSSDNYFDEIGLDDVNVRSNYLLWYPLLAACSFICASRKSSFHSEYIVPQLFSQWLRDRFSNTTLHGIRYFSCRSKAASKLGINYMFPTVYDKSNRRFCSILSSAFVLTKPIHMTNFKTVNKCEEFLLQDNDLKSI